METLHINLKKEIDTSYDIVFGSRVGESLNDFLLQEKVAKVCIVTDSNVKPLYYENLVKILDKSLELFCVDIQAGEEYKEMESVLTVCKSLLANGFNRADYIVALSGGVVGDIAGFAASIYKRGVNVIQIPTTLLSMFDSSVGGKTGVDFGEVKNILGNFKQPKKVFINPEFLQTLPTIEILSGYFEGLKHSLLDSREYYREFKIEGEKLLAVGAENFLPLQDELNKIISRNVCVKANIVMEDETELGVRKFLNYGHTFGHALEGVTNFSITHGVCVGFGMLYVNILSYKLGYLSGEDLKEINGFILAKLSILKELSQEGFTPLQNLGFEEIYIKMTKDKKNTDVNISFTLLNEPGKLHIEKVGTNKKTLLAEVFDEFKIFIKQYNGL